MLEMFDLRQNRNKLNLYFITFYTLVYSVLRLTLNNFNKFARIYINESKDHYVCYKIYCIINWILWSILSLTSVMLFAALIANIRKLMLPWMLWMYVILIGVPVAEICILYALQNYRILILLIVLTLIFTGINAYCLLSAHFYYKIFYKDSSTDKKKQIVVYSKGRKTKPKKVIKLSRKKFCDKKVSQFPKHGKKRITSTRFSLPFIEEELKEQLSDWSLQFD